MTEEVSANPQGAESKPLYRTEDIAERLRGVLGQDQATDETNAEEAAQVEGADADVETEVETEAEPTEQSETTDTPEAEEQPKGRYKVKVNGEELTVTFDELRKGYQLESDYRQKTAKLAEERKTLEAERSHYAEQLKTFVPALQTQIQDKFGNVDWVKLSQEDPAGYVRLRAEYEQYATRMQMALAEQQRIELQTKQEQEAQLKESLQEESRKLAEKVPEFADPVKGKALREEIKTYLRSEGYSGEEVQRISNHRDAIVARKAMLYDKAQKAKAQAVQKPVPKVQKPGTATRTDPQASAVIAAQERFGKSGKVEDLAAVLRARNRQS